jgi:hypothetical protein
MRALKDGLMCDQDDGFDGFDWEDIALIGALSESLSEERKECERIRRELEKEQGKDKENEDPIK